jgi:hypothetical protein
MALPKVSTQEAETPEEGIYDPGDLKNRYNEAADRLREEVKRFVYGARRQRVLPFNNGEEEGKKRGKKKGILKSAADAVGGLFNRSPEAAEKSKPRKGEKG